MHEASLVRSLLGQVERLMRERAARRVVAVKLSVGELSGVEPELMRLAFERLSVTTPVRGARLHMRTVPLAAECNDCGRRFEVHRFTFVCPTCGGAETRVVSGEELTLESVTLEADSP